jgi:hypothetical protein
LPFSVNIYAIADEPLTEVFMQDDLLTPIGEISPELMKANFEHLRTIADLVPVPIEVLGHDVVATSEFDMAEDDLDAPDLPVNTAPRAPVIRRR